MLRNRVPAFWCLLALLLLLGTAAPALADTAYVVQAGDTLAAIARRFNTTIDILAQANNIVNPNLIYVGQTLIIPGDETPAPAPPPPPATGGSVYVVQAGDTLFGIALRFGATVQAVAQANGIGNTNLIFVGQSLLIPGGGVPAPPPPPAPAPPPDPTPVPDQPPPPPPPPPPTGANLLPNPSFEDGWYNLHGVPELQVPNQWTFTWDEGDNPFDPQPHSAFVRPETRVLSGGYLPPNERDLFIWNGQHTVKIFKGSGAISGRLLTSVTLQPGTYRMTINVFPDLVSDYHNGEKIWAPDPFSGEVRFMVGGGGSDWLLPAFGQRNTLSHTFTINSAQTIQVGLALRGRYALPNNGWFMDDWTLFRLS